MMKNFKEAPRSITAYKSFLGSNFDLEEFSMNYNSDKGINFSVYGE